MKKLLVVIFFASTVWAQTTTNAKKIQGIPVSPCPAIANGQTFIYNSGTGFLECSDQSGTQGPAGTSLLSGTAVPSTEGNNGDFYIRTTNSCLYGPKDTGAWPGTCTSLIGTQGAAGFSILNGTAVPTTEGVDGDFYIRTTTNFIYGPKSSSTWPAGVSLVGPAGAAGPTGPAGSLATGDTTHSGAILFNGLTSGGLAFGVADIAGTATTLIYPTDTATATTGYVMALGDVITCPTLPSYAPAVCRVMTWEIGGGGGGGTGVGRATLAATWTSIPDIGCQEQTATWTGVTTSDTVALGIPAAFTAGLLANARVSATNTVAIRICNTTGASVTLGLQTFAGTLAVYNLSGTSTINFTSIGDGACASNTFALTGVAAGDGLIAKWPAGLETGLVGNVVASATDTVQVRLCNWSGASVDPASATFGASVAK